MNDLETTALVLHEAVIRGKLTTGSAAGRDTHDCLAMANHPLASLPITLFDLEENVHLPKYGLGSSGTGIPFGPTREEPAVALAPLTSNLEITETTAVLSGRTRFPLRS